MVSSKHQRTLEAVFATPTRADLRWSDVERLIAALGGQIEERAGSRVLIRLGGKRAVFHRPHPKPQTDKGALVALRRFLESAGVTP